jgi:hypothetical protein
MTIDSQTTDLARGVNQLKELPPQSEAEEISKSIDLVEKVASQSLA